jgi:hypothetical protein
MQTIADIQAAVKILRGCKPLGKGGEIPLPVHPESVAGRWYRRFVLARTALKKAGAARSAEGL